MCGGRKGCWYVQHLHFGMTQRDAALRPAIATAGKATPQLGAPRVVVTPYLCLAFFFFFLLPPPTPLPAAASPSAPAPALPPAPPS